MRKISTKPPGSQTGISLSKCYAAPLKDCGGSIEKEHPLAKCALLELFANESFDATGWVAGKNIVLTAENASSNILCSRHNRALSSIDDTLKKWTRAVKMIHGDIEPTSHGYININSRELALILLQISCGLIAINKKEIPIQWLEILFSMIDYDLKLYQTGKPGDFIRDEKRFNHTVLEINNVPIGCALNAKGFTVATFIGCQPPTREYFPSNKIIAQLLKNGSVFEIKFK